MHVSSKSTQFGRRLSVILVLSVTSVAQACLWDWDTLQMERRRFPGTLEMITGRFVRHSHAYYEWRIEDRQKRMPSSGPGANPALADDLAVAYAKLGRNAEAIALLEQVLGAHPDRYETLSNLGTIKMLDCDLQAGKDYIDQAIVINPNAHFGREKYQTLLAEYFLTDRKTPHPHSEHTFHLHPKEAIGFAEFVLNKKHLQTRFSGRATDERERKENKEAEDELAAAQKGVLGMMHFANYDSPLLLEALGDLLTAWPTHEKDAMHLAARAYLRIAQQSEDPKIREEFEKVAANVVYGNLDYIRWRDKEQKSEGERVITPKDTVKLAADLANELEVAKEFVASIEADEKRWIADGVDVDQAFAAKYYNSLDETVEAAKKQLANERRDVRGNPYQESMNRGLLMIGAVMAIFAAIVWGARLTFRRIRSRFDKQKNLSAE